MATIELVNRAVREKPYNEKDVLEGLNRELVPLIREIRTQLNALLNVPDAVRTVTSATTAVYGEFLLCDTNGGDITVTLPAPSALPNRLFFLPVFIIVNTGSNTLTMDPDGTTQINGAATLVAGPSASIIYCDGTNYWRDF